MSQQIPDFDIAWATSGDKSTPPDIKLDQGWVPEIPTHALFNWWQNRADLAIQAILANNRGATESSVQGLRDAQFQTLHYSTVFLSGHTSAGDGGGGFYRADLADTTTADNNGTVIVDDNLVRWKWVDFGVGVSVKVFGAKGDAVTLDTAAINSTIAYIKANAVSGIGQNKIIFPETDSNKYYLVDGTILFEDMIQVEISGGQGAHIRNNTTDVPLIHIKGTVGFGNVFGFNMNNIFLQHTASGTASALELERCILSWFSDIYIDTAPGHAINLGGASSENHFKNIIIEDPGKNGINCQSDLNHFTDIHVLSAGESGFSFVSGAHENTCIGCVSYLNAQHGFSDVGTLNKFIGCTGRNNSVGSPDTYSGLALAGTNGQAIGFMGYDTQGSPTQKYGVRVAGTGNQVIGVKGTGNISGLVADFGTASDFWLAGTAQVNGFTHKTPIIHKNADIFTNGDTTPSISGGNLFRTANAAPTSITTFDDGVNGQEFRIIVEDANTTFVHSAGMLIGGSNITPPANSIMYFARIGTVYHGRQL